MEKAQLVMAKKNINRSLPITHFQQFSYTTLVETGYIASLHLDISRL